MDFPHPDTPMTTSTRGSIAHPSRSLSPLGAWAPTEVMSRWIRPYTRAGPLVGKQDLRLCRDGPGSAMLRDIVEREA